MVTQEDMVERVFQSLQGALSDSRAQFTLPNSNAMPSHIGQCYLVSLISQAVTFNFSMPEVNICLGHSEILATFVPMPETAIYENARAVLPHDEVGMSWQSMVI